MPDVLRRDHGVAARMLAVAQQHESSDEFRSRALELPAMLQRSGLVASLVYLAGKDKPDHRTPEGLLADAIAAEVGERLGRAPVDCRPMRIVAFLTTADHGSAVVAERHAADAAAWLKRLVEALRVVAP